MEEAITITLGRADDCTLVFDDPKISGRHARLEALGGGRYRLTDLGSRNGTFVEQDGRLERVESSVTVAAGHRVHFGACTATVRELVDMAGGRGRTPAGAGDRMKMVRCGTCGWIKPKGADCPNPLCGDPTASGEARR